MKKKPGHMYCRMGCGRLWYVGPSVSDYEVLHSIHERNRHESSHTATEAIDAMRRQEVMA
jgi:hypothetical protein